MQRAHVRVFDDSLAFSAAHFITLGEDQCEPLHGHDYRVSAQVHAPLDANQCVVDFLALRATLKAILGQWNHRVLLPTAHPRLKVTADQNEVAAVLGQRRWVFPRSDCALVPCANTTAELLARQLAHRLLEELPARTGCRPLLVRVELTEGVGQSAIWEISAENGGAAG